MHTSQEASAKRVVRILVPEEPFVSACTSRCELKPLITQGCSPCYIACTPSSSQIDCPSWGSADVVSWHATDQKQVAEIRTGEPFDLANFIFYSTQLDLQRPWEAESTGPVPNELRNQLSTTQAALCDRGRSQWKQNLARLLCCSSAVREGPGGEMSSMTARVLQRLLVWDKNRRADRVACSSHLLWRALLSTFFAHALAWLITSLLPHSSVVDSSRVHRSFDAVRRGLDW